MPKSTRMPHNIRCPLQEDRQVKVRRPLQAEIWRLLDTPTGAAFKSLGRSESSLGVYIDVSRPQGRSGKTPLQHKNTKQQ